MENPYQLLERSLEKSLAVEREQYAELQQRHAKALEFEDLCRERLDAYRIQLNAHRNILVLPNLAEYDLQEAQSQHLATLNKISERAAEIEEWLRTVRRRIETAREKLNSYREQMADAEQEAAASEWAGETREKLARLISILTDQQAVLAKIEGVYADLLERTRKIRSEYEKTAGLFEQRFAELEEERLLRRSINPLSQLGAERIQLEVKRLTGKVRLFFSYGYWQDIGVSDTKAYTLFLLVYFLLFAALETVLGFIRRFLLRVRDRCLERGNFWQYLTVRLVRRSLYLGGAILYIFLFPVKPAYAFTPLFTFLRLLAELGIVILMARWGLNFLHVLWSEAGAAFYRFLHAYLKFLLYGIMAFGIVYYLLGAAICETCVLLVLIRLAFEVGLLAWSVLFWHRFRFYSQGSPLAAYHWFAVVKPLLPAAGYLIVLVGLFFEGIGYGAMATLWYTSLARTAAAFMWIVVLYRVLKEVSPGGQAAEEEPQPPGVEKPMPVRWLLIRLGKALLLVFAVLAVPMAWGAREAFLGDFFFALNYQVRLGDMQISFLDVAVAILIVLLTHTVVIIWKALLREKILARREMEPGLKDSITTITGYIGWVIGIVIVFRVIGVSAASLAVLFGAVGIGIGFGLQNIFNNFLSGIILLFERPIQVGDVVEINGVWGAVTKINVRATQVKTYDNADLIIPNADFISNQLTNWSFKDARVRRTITVGVAYGSDISLVRETLYEIAANNSGVYRRPQPDVLFTEFGESALIFQLRVWAHINYFLNVETEIRFEITEKFRELGIHIPFPQRDVYLKAETPEMREPSPNL